MTRLIKVAAVFAAALLAASAAVADPAGTYVRFGVASTFFQPGEGRWLPPGYPGDPAVYHDVTGGMPFAVSGAVGYDFGSNLRADISVEHVFSQNITGLWSYTVPATAGPHADMDTTLSSTVVMVNGFYSFDLGDSAAPVSPFLTGGVGVAFNHVGDWTRTNAAVSPTTRTFEGATKASLAWSVGAGVSIDLSGDSGMPMYLDLSYRYLNMGNAMGSTVPYSGSGIPVEAFNFTNSAHEFGASIRIPLNGS